MGAAPRLPAWCGLCAACMLQRTAAAASHSRSGWLRPREPAVGTAGALLQRLKCCPWGPGAAAPASSSASRVARKRKQKLRFRYVKAPDRFFRQADGDFPVQLRPVGPPPSTRDLQDSALDAEAAEEGDVYRAGPKPKPHRVREAVRAQQGSDSTTLLDGGAATTVAALREKRTGQVSQVAELNPERDMKEEDAAEFSAYRARALAKRNYKWMPNPFGPKPAALGSGPEAEAKYYERYFDGRRLAQDRPARSGAGVAGVEEELPEGGRLRPRRERISPKRFWYKPDYVTPEPHSVAMMSSRELKFAMVNEAHLVRKQRNGQRQGRAAGLPLNGAELWLAFGLRAAEVAHVDRGATLGSPSPSGTDGDAESKTASVIFGEIGARVRRPPCRCSLPTTLRFLQAMASVQAGPHTAILQLLSRVLGQLQELKPHQCFFVLQAMSRLGIKHPKSILLLQQMSLAWRTLPDKTMVKAANAVAKLDLGGHLWAKPLKLAIIRTLPRLSPQHFMNLKSITVMELLDDPEAMRAYLEQTLRLRSHVWYSRHLQMVELHAHLLHPELWESLDEQLRFFLQQVRTAAQQSREDEQRSSQRAADEESSHSGSEDDSGESSGSESEARNGLNAGPSWKKDFDKLSFSSALHQDVSRILAILGVEHHNKLAAGPLTVDICHVPTMTVVEAAARWQYYVRSPQVTALARRRQELLRAMGFQLVLIPYHRWDVLESDEDKTAYLRSKLPPEVLIAMAAH